MYRANLGRFEPTGATSLAQLDPDAAQQVEDAYNAVTDLDSDGKLTRYERSVVRGEIANITGIYLGPTASMPTLATVDAGGAGALYTIRQQSRDLGLPTNNATYVRLGNAYNSLRTYLNGLPIKPWNTSNTATLDIVSATWDARWNEYFLSYNYLQVVNNQRAQQYAEEEAGEAAEQARKDAIAAVSNSLAHATVPISNPVTIDAPIATIALPEFEGRHMDGWEAEGRNIIVLNSIAQWGGGFTRNGGTFTLNVRNTGLRLPNDRIKPSTTYVLSFKVKKLSGSVTALGGHSGPISTSTTYLDGSVVPGSYLFAYPDDELEHLVEVELTTRSSITDYIYIQPNRSHYDLDYVMEIWDLKMTEGPKRYVYTPAPEEVKPDGIPRIQPITSPIFNGGTTMAMLVKAYGDGTTNDKVEWDAFGNPVKIKHWDDVLLDGSQSWGVHATAAYGHMLIASNFAPANPVAHSVQGVKYDAQFLTTRSSSTLTQKDEAYISSFNNLIISVAHEDSGWGSAYSPTGDEIKAYFNGWKMCNGTFGAAYNGSGTKTWHPVGDSNLNRAETTLPTGHSLAITEKTINQYQVLYRLQDPVQEVIGFDGLLNLIQGENSINISYAQGTPEIVTGTIKYATNLATANRDLTYLIPTLQTRLSSAEEIITDDSIVNKVMNSVSYQIGLASKADSSELSNYAPSSAVEGLADDIGELANAVNSIDLTPYITQSELDQTATQITAKFSATGGMNLIKNSIGFSDLDFWESIYVTPVETIAKNELDILGFGSGFVFSNNGQNQGIAQKVAVNPGQPYTLSWYLEKLSSGTTSGHRFYIQILEDDVIRAQIADNSNIKTDGYEAQHLTYIPQTGEITVRFIGYANVDAILTGVMLTIGDIPLQWSLATGELYNTNIRMDINGIRVSQYVGADGDRQEVGYTAITPDEFAGYALIGGVFQKIFYLNGQETVTKKLRAEEEITMGTVKILRVNSSGNTGWAFIKNSRIT